MVVYAHTYTVYVVPGVNPVKSPLLYTQVSPGPADVRRRLATPECALLVSRSNVPDPVVHALASVSIPSAFSLRRLPGSATAHLITSR